ncbi:MAG: peptidoglycan-binding protein, partial [Pseudomonadota bacterium]
MSWMKGFERTHRLWGLVLCAGLLAPVAAPVQAQTNAERLLGLGAAIVLDRIIKTQREEDAEQQRQQQERPQDGATAPAGAADQGAAPSPAASAAATARQEAMALQRDLNALGFNAGPVDGLPGAQTRRAVEAYQVSRGFPATGQLTELQRLALVTDAQAEASGGVQTPERRRTEVYEAQSYLASLGYDVGRPDGAWGPRSQGALEAFRRDVGMTGAGRPLGQSDAAALYAGVHGVPPTRRAGALRVANAAIAGGGGAAASGLVAAAQAGPSFDCARAATATEQAICASPRLSDLDRQLAEAWGAARAAAADPEALVSAQRAWLQARDACAGDAACLETTLSGRVVQLTGRPAAPTRAGGATGAATVAGIAAATFDAQGARPATAPNVAPAGAPPLGAGAWAHVEGGRMLSGPQDLPRRLMLAHVALRPDTVARDNVVSNLLQQDRAAREGISARDVRDELAAMNPLTRQDVLAAYRAELIDEAQRAPALAQTGPIPVAVYIDPLLLNRNAPPSFVQGQGMRLRNDAQLLATLPRVGGFPQDFTLDLLLPGTDVIPMGREEASAFLDAWSVNRAQRRRLVQVVWGQVTRLGVDETVAAFAEDGQLYGGLPATFEPQRVTLHWLDPAQGRARPIVTEATPAVYEWSLEGRGAPQGSADALALARELGLPIEDGHVLSAPSGGRASSGQTRDLQSAWRRLADLAWLGRNPDAAREGDGFALVAASLLPDVQKRRFFGERQVNPGYPLASLAGERGAQFATSLAQSAFPDEFARQDAKTAFFAEYYDGILARRPAAPLPLL